MSVVIIIADSQRHYDAAYDLMEREGVDTCKLEFPTMLAYDTEDHELIGMLGTFHQDELIFCGPLVLESSFPRLKTALQLCSDYEATMRKMGVKSFILWVDDGNIIDQSIKRYIPDGVELYATEGTRKFYIRRL
jgi:hypothetical protein